MYKENRLVAGRVRLRGERVDLTRIEQNLLVVTAGADHIAPPAGTMPLFDLVSSEDVTHFDRPGGHIGLMAGSKAKHEIWPELARLVARALGPLKPLRGDMMSSTPVTTPNAVDGHDAPACTAASRSSPAAPGDRRGDLPQPRRAGRGRGGRLQPRP